MEHQTLASYLRKLLQKDLLSYDDLTHWEWGPKGLSPETDSRIGIGDRFRLSVAGPREGIPAYSVSFYQLYYLYTGAMTFEFDMDSLTLAPGQALLIPPGTQVTVSPCQGEDRAIHLGISPGLLAQLPGIRELPAFSSYLEECPGLPAYIRFSTVQFPITQWYMDEMCCEHFDPDRHTYMMIPSLLNLLLASLDRCADLRFHARASAGRLTVNEIQRFIKTNYASCSLQSTAQRFGFSPNYLSYLLKKVTGMGFQELKQAESIAQSARMLLETNLTVAQISRAVGIRNITHFYNLFSQRFGMTPAQYRQQETDSSR